MSPAPEARAALDRELLDWMAEPEWQRDETRFETLALGVFAHQFHHCPPYARFAEARGCTPERVTDWREIPPVPTGAFKEVALRGFSPAETVKTFRTSGTSGQKRGALHLDTLALYEASLLASLETLLVPDRRSKSAEGGQSEPIHIRVLAPSATEMPESSLSHMFETFVAKFGSRASGFDIVEGHLCIESLIEHLQHAQESGEPVLLCGTAFSFVHLLEKLGPQGREFCCPPGSRLMETGGFKGQSREMPAADLYAGLERLLGISPSHMVNQYGMTELGSQFYDSVWIDPEGPRRKIGPPWTRVRLLDPETGLEVKPGEPGMVVIYDLANSGSVAAIQTADLGRAVPDPGGGPTGFEILGRRPGAEARGCSIAADEMLGTEA